MKFELKQKLQQDLKELDSRITASKLLIGILALVLVIAYFGWFNYKSIPVSVDSGDWGTLGDFIGGILNPLIAFSAFYWLTTSVRIQKEELGETRATLEETSNAQSVQTQISAFTALISSATSEVDVLHTRLTYLCAQFKDGDIAGILDLRGNWLSTEAARVEIASINADITEQLGRKLNYENAILKLLQANKDSDEKKEAAVEETAA